MNPEFSIIIPSYNRADKIKRTILSALDQDFKGHYEVLVIDDGSTDDTKSIIQSIDDKRVHYFYKENGERGAARNLGIDKARGDFLTFLDSDDLYYPTHLEQAARLVSEGRELFWIPYEEIDNETRKVKRQFTMIGEDLNQSLIKKGNFMSCHGVFGSKEIFDQHRFIEDRRLAGSEDWQLWLRLAARYTFFQGDRISHALVHHDDRSVFNFAPEELKGRFEILLNSLKEDSTFMSTFGDRFNFIRAESDSYIALHGMMSKDFPISEALSYFLNSLGHRPAGLFRKRTLAIIKHFLNRVIAA